LKPETAINLQPVFACLLLVAWPVYLVTVPAAWACSWLLGLGEYLAMLWRYWKAPIPPVVVSVPQGRASKPHADDAAEPAGGDA
jgi:hypothetical protein